MTMLELTAVQQLCSAQVMQLLETAVVHGSGVFIYSLKWLQPAVQPSSDQLMSLLQAAAMAGNAVFSFTCTAGAMHCAQLY
jgi:hypothetical protein